MRRNQACAGPRARTAVRRRVHMLLATFAAGAAVVTCALIPAGAGAYSASQIPPINADAGEFTLPISCAITLPQLGNLQFFTLSTNVTVKGAVADSVGPGQQFSLSEGSGYITFPSWISWLASIIGVKTADATISQLNIGAQGATPSSINVAATPVSVNGIALKAGQSFTVGLPTSGTFTVGPYTAPNSGVVTLNFGGALATVDLVNSAGNTVLKLGAKCTASAGNALLSLDVGGASGQAPSVISGAPVNFTAPASGGAVGIVNAPYACSLDGQTIDVGIAVGGNFPLALSGSSGQLTFTNGSGALDIPASTVNQLLAAGVNELSGSVTQLNLDAAGGTPAVDNVASSPIAVPPVFLTKDTPVVISLPALGTLTAGPFSPSPGSSAVTVTMGSAAASFNINGSLTATSATCNAPTPSDILVDDPVT